MADGTQVWLDAFLEINGVNLTDHVGSLTLNYAADAVDATVMGNYTRIFRGGLREWSFDVTFRQDFAAGEVDATLFPLIGTSSCIEVRPFNACSSANNPIFSGIALLENYPPMSGGVGAMLDVAARFRCMTSLNRASSSG